jgi:hypothetical protein
VHDLIHNLTEREIIIYFFIKYTKNKLNKNCNDRKFYTRRNYDFVYDYIQNYYKNCKELENSSITRKYYHIFNWNADIKEEKYFVNFREGYIGVSKRIKNNKINYKNVMNMRIPYSYSEEKVVQILKDDKNGKDKIKNMNNFSRFKDKILLHSIYKYTENFKKINLNCRISILLNDIKKEDMLCPICKEERSTDYNNLYISCGRKICIKKIHSEKSKKIGTSMMQTEIAKQNRKKALIGRKFTEEQKRKIGLSNSKLWTPEYREKFILMKKEKNLSQRQSETMKRKILAGEFTPKTENRKRSKRLKSDITGITYRSNWELIFHEKNPHLKYENIRIEYIEDGKSRIYITDFSDMNKKIIYEIKPTSELNNKNFLNKKVYTEKWCSENGFTYEVITEKDYDFYGRRQNKL